MHRLPFRLRCAPVRRSALALVAAVALCAAAPLAAQEEAMEAADTSPVVEMIRADWDGVSEKLTSLAEAIPEDAYGWAPAEEVRSVGEVVIHVAGPNFGLSQALLGAEAEGANPLRELGESPSKEEILAAFGASVERVDGLMAGLTEADLEKSYEAFGRQMSGYRVVNILTTHSHEHLGQLIAYARANGVAPPWSR